jgi:hypothetical protein
MDRKRRLSCVIGFHKWIVDPFDWAHIMYCLNCDEIDWADVKFDKLEILEEINMKKDVTYDSVMEKVSAVLEKSGATNEEAYVILESIQQKMLVELMKKLKVM